MRNLTEGNEAKLIIAFTVPMLIGNVFQQLYSTMDAMIVGIGVGKEALAAIGVSIPLIFLMISLIMGISMGGGVVLSQYFGARDHERLRKAMHTMYVFLFYASLVTTVVGIAIAGPVLRLIGTPDAYFEPARIYLQITFAGMPFVFGYNAISSVLRALGDSKNPLYFLIWSSLLNIALVALFVLVFGWGVEGSAWATFIAQAFAFGISVRYIQTSKEKLVRVAFKEFVITGEELAKIFRIGLPTAVQMGLVSLSFIALSAIVNPFGTDVMAGYTAASRLDSFAILPAMNLSIAISTFVGQNLGARKPERVTRGLLATLIMGGGISAVLSIVFILFPRPLMSLFSGDPAVIQYGAEYLVIVSSFYILFAAMFTLAGVLRGAGAAAIAMVATVVAVWVVRIPASFGLSLAFGPTGIWWGIPLGWAAGLILTLVYYLTGRWKKIVLVEKAPSTPQAEALVDPPSVLPAAAED